MGNHSTTDDRSQKPFYHMPTDVFAWHQYQGKSTNDCAAYCVATVGNAILNRAQFDGDSVAREMEKLVWVHGPLPHLTIRKFPRWASLPWGVSGYLQSQGIPAKLRWMGNMEDLLRNIREDRFTIVLVAGLGREPRAAWAHAKVLYGYEPPTGPEVPNLTRPKHGFYFVDPGFEKGQSGLPRLSEGVFWQDEHEFRREWGNLLRVCIEAGPKASA